MVKNRPLLTIALVSAVLIAGLLWLLPSPRSSNLLVYCAAGLRGPIDQIAKEYESEFGARIEIQYGGSNTLLSQIEVSGQGDIFLAADDSYLALGREKGLLADSIPLATMSAVVAVKRGNPRQVSTLDDLLHLRVAIANPGQAAIGRETRRRLESHAKWEVVRNHVRAKGVFKPTVGEIANDVMLGSVDAGIVWDAVAAQYSELEVVELPELEGGDASIAVAVLNCSANESRARDFCRFLAAREHGLRVLKLMNYRPAVGDPSEGE